MKIFSSALFFYFTLFIVSPLVSHAAALDIPRVDDWSLEATLASKENKPIMVVFGSATCHYCDKLNQQLLSPMIKNGDLTKRVHLREFSIDRGGKVIDFDSMQIRSRLFVSRYKVFATPTVILLDAAGNVIGEPIVGFNNAASYHLLLDEAIKTATLHQHTQQPRLVTQLP